MPNDDYGLRTIGFDGKVPACRMRNAMTTVDVVQRLVDNDTKRSFKRGQVNGLLDGNPPYSASKTREAGRADKTNINWGTGRAYLESGKGAFWDLYAEAPGVISIETDYGSDRDMRREYSRIMSVEAGKLIKRYFSHDIKVSNQQMVHAGFGPLYFEDAQRPFPRSMDAGCLLVPDRTLSKPDEWDLAVVLQEYYPPRLYEFIENEKAAWEVGWNVRFTKDVIAYAVDQKQPDQRTYNWEWFQQELKENSYNYVGSETKVCRLAHVFWPEFGKVGITHAIIERTNCTPAEKGAEYLFLHIGRYQNWRQIIHPMYYDEGRAGAHHMVTGLGVKQFGAMRTENELLCDMMDGARAPKTFFKCTTQEAFQKAQIMPFGQWGFMPPGTEVSQTPVAGMINDGMAMYRATSDLMRSNLSQYRQQVEPDKPGNPATAFEKRLQATQQGALSNTVYSEYYDQLDRLYEEMACRFCNINTSNDLCKEFQRECEEQGVPKECFGRIRNVKAVRLVGQGSPYMRAQNLNAVAAVIRDCPEDGQKAWVDDVIAANVGGDAVQRYNPSEQPSSAAADQRERAMTQVGLMKIGVPATFAPSQNATVFAGLFLKSCVEALTSVQKGGNPQQVLAFVELASPVALAHIQRLAKDPLRADIARHFEEQFKRVGKLVDKLKALVAKQAQNQKQLQDKAQGQITDGQIKGAKVMGDLALKKAKQDADLNRKAEAHRQQLALNDARTASEINLGRYRALAE
jgi:hypothetical protein